VANPARLVFPGIKSFIVLYDCTLSMIAEKSVFFYRQIKQHSNLCSKRENYTTVYTYRQRMEQAGICRLSAERDQLVALASVQMSATRSDVG
jgi:hypothetical protein